MTEQQNEQTKKKRVWEVKLPDNEHGIQQWLVSDGSFVQQGDKVATAVKKSTATSTTTASAPPATAITTTVVVKHKRPKKRKRAPPTSAAAADASNNTAAASKPAATNTVKKLSGYLPKVTDTIVAPADGIIRIQGQPPLDAPLRIAFIEPCLHPAIMGGLCAVCGASMKPTLQQLQEAKTHGKPSNNNNSNMSQVTVAGGVTMTISEKEALQMSRQTCRKLLENKKLSLVLDLDHTLVHATADVRARTHHLGRTDVRTLILPIQLENGTTRWMQHYVKLRPHVHEFLQESCKKYEISVYTAGTRMYAEHVCMLLSRNIVGADKDEEELQRMRHAVMSAEYEMASINKKNTQEGKNDDNKSDSKQENATTATDDAKAPAAQSKDATQVANGDAHDNTTTNTDKDSSSSSSKKKVSFGEPPKEQKTDAMTPERLEQLKTELQEAEKMEQEALRVRQEIFGSRIVSRTDVGDLGRDVKSLERIFPGGGSMALIVDDREDVWANAQDNSKTSGEPPENLLLIRPYHWKPFLGFADVNNAAGEDISGESTTTEDEDDCALLWTLDILKRTHKRFYDAIDETGNRDITVPPLLREMRREVLEGCTLVFSGLVPLHHQNRASRFPRPGVVRYGESLGARVLDTVDNTVTHCVAARDGTDKIHKARRVPGCVVVKASWLMECVWTMTRRDVKPHLLGKSTSSASTTSTAKQDAAAKAPVAAAKELASSSSDDDEDDDLVAMLEADMAG